MVITWRRTHVRRFLNAPRGNSSMSIMGGRGAAAAAALLLALLGEVAAFYLPGVAPRKYKTGERMRVKVNTLTSDLTPLQVVYCVCIQAQPRSSCLLCVVHVYYRRVSSIRPGGLTNWLKTWAVRLLQHSFL